MTEKNLKVTKCPTDELSLTNCAVISEQDYDTNRISVYPLGGAIGGAPIGPGGKRELGQTGRGRFQNARLPIGDRKFLYIARHVEVITGHRYVFTIKSHPSIRPGEIGFSAAQRKWAVLSLGQQVSVRPYQFDPSRSALTGMVVEVDFLQKKSTTTEPYDTNIMAVEFVNQFPQQAFTVGQELVFAFKDKKVLQIIVKDLEVLDMSAGGKAKKVTAGFTTGNTAMCFDKAENSPINLTGKCKGKQATTSILNPDWNFGKMGIGGLDDQFSAIFRRAFASRVFPPEVVEQLGMKHCRGILLFGPPGTGKTLMARQIGKMLNAREPKIVNGPQILDKYVGESEANIRKLFAEAEEEEKRMGPNSGLHIIIFDEIDAICKARGSVAGSTAVHDTVVNQLLSKIDGVDQLNNILVIGMTNRKDMIDDALLRPGRLEVQMEIGLPDENGRAQILRIHTARLTEHKKLTDDFDISELATSTKNFSGAEIEGLVRAATSTAMNRLVKATSKVEIDPEAVEKLKVSMADFRHALQNDVKPAFGISEEEIAKYVGNGIIRWGELVSDVLDDIELRINQTRDSTTTSLVTVLLEGAPGSGKTAIAAYMAKQSDFPFLKICAPKNMIGYHEAAKVQAIKKIFDDAYKSQLSCIILDGIERLLDYTAIGPRFSNLVLQALLVLLNETPPHGRKLLVICTTSCKDVMRDMQMLSVFTKVIHVSNISRPEHLMACLREIEAFTPAELVAVEKWANSGKKIWIGIKKLLLLVDAAKQLPIQDASGGRIHKFLIDLEEESESMG